MYPQFHLLPCPKLARMGRREQVTRGKLSAISYQLSAFASAMRACVSPLLLRRKVADNLRLSAGLSLVQGAGDTPLRSPSLPQSAGSAQSPRRPFDKFPQLCSSRSKATLSASDWSSRTSLPEGRICLLYRRQE